MAHGHGSHDDGEKHAGYWWLFVCVIGMISSLTMYGIVLEYVTSGKEQLHELSFVFVTTAIYSMTAYVARGIFNEKPTDISKYNMLILSLTSISSTYTSVRSLRYVIYPVQVLFKSCKPVPVMFFGVVLGKKYSLQKYVNVMIITTGVALFMGGGSSTSKHSTTATTADTTLIGGALLLVSLCFDGVTGAYEDQLMSKDHVEPFDLMYNIQLGKAVISFCCLVATNGLNAFIGTLQNGGLSLVALGLTGAVGQVFVFVTINKFGALNCALIGLFRKILSLVLSFVLYGHTLNAFQGVGLLLAITAMIANFWEKKPSKHGHGGHGGHGAGDSEGTTASSTALLAPDNEVDEDDIESPTIDSPVPSASNTPARKAKSLDSTASTIAAAAVSPVDLINEPNEGANDLLDMANTIEMTTTVSSSKQLSV